MDLNHAFTEFAYAKDHTPASQLWYKARLGAFMAWAKVQGVSEIEDVTAPLVRRYVDERRTTPTQRGGHALSSHTLHGHVRAIRAWLKWAANEDLLDERVVRRIALPKREQKVVQVLSPRQFDLLMAATERSEMPEYVARDRAILAVLLDSGIRAGELTGLLLDWVHFTPDEAWLHIHGKGRKQREVPLGKRSRHLLHRYLYRHRPDTQDAHVFLAKGGTPLTPEGLDRLLYRLRDRVGREHFVGVEIRAHVFRHSFAVRALENGLDVYRLSRLMGHSTVSTTEGYLRAVTCRQARQGAVSVLDVM